MKLDDVIMRILMIIGVVLAIEGTIVISYWVLSLFL